MTDASGQPHEPSSAPSTPPASIDLTRLAGAHQSAEFDQTQVEADSLAVLRDLKLDSQVGANGSLGRLGDYDIRAVVGQGGMGIVFRAHDETLKRTVAIKVLNPRLSSSERFRRRFLQEARAAAAINHPNVVTIHAVGEHLGHPFLVMEYVEGTTLRRRIDAPPRLGFRDILRIGAQIADGLRAAHDRGVVHRDIKPMNILLENGVERVKIADFGLARAALETSDLTSLGSVVGTPAYMAPEQVNGGQVDQRTDLFSLGCVMYAMGTGRSPFQGTDVMNIVSNLAQVVPPPLCSVNHAIPQALSDVVARLLRKNPAERFQTAREVAALLSQMLAASIDRPTDQIRLAAPPAAPLPPARRLLAGGMLLAATLAGWLLAGRPGWPRRPDLAPSANHAPAANADDEAVLLARRRAAAVERKLLTVSAAPGAEFERLDEALEAVAYAGTTIRILDSRKYTGSLAIDDAARHAGLVIEAAGGTQPSLATPRGFTGPVLTIRGVPDVVVRGVSIDAVDQVGVEIRGNSPGLVLQELHLRQRGSSPAALFNVVPGAGGTIDRPVVIFRCRAVCNTGQCIWMKGTLGNPVQSVHALENWFTSEADGSLVVLWGSLRDVTVHRNVFVGGGIGINLNFAPPDRAIRARLTNNTFFRSPYWLGFVSTLPEQVEEISVINNLILETPAMEAGVRPLGEFAGHAGWLFQNNVWETMPGGPAPGMAAFAALVERASVASRDAHDDGFLRPAADSALASLGQGGELPRYVGALPP